MERPGQSPGRIVPDDDACVDPERVQVSRLTVGVVDHAAPERPRERHDDTDLHPVTPPSRLPIAPTPFEAADPRSLRSDAMSPMTG
jgi:hypothetical protein